MQSYSNYPTEAGNLAARSSPAAKETGELIADSIQAVSEGLAMAEFCRKRSNESKSENLRSY